jgi:hypothetical protein
MLAPGLVAQLESTRKFFGTTTSIFEEADAGYSPTAEMYTVAGQVAHAADTLDWFVDGALGKGWDMDFEASIARAKTPRTRPRRDARPRFSTPSSVRPPTRRCSSRSPTT